MNNQTTDRNRVLLNYSRDKVFMVNPETLVIEEASQAASHYLGYENAELVGLAVTEIDADISAMFFWDEIKAGTETGISDVSGFFLAKDGTEKSIKKTVYTVSNDDDHFIIVHIDDNSQAKRDEETLMSMSAQLKATLEATSDGILVLNKNRRIENMNHRFSDMWAIPKETVEQGSEAVMHWLASNLKDEEAFEQIKNILSSELEGDEELTLELSNNNILDLKIHPQVIMGKQSGYVLNFHDITQRIEYENALIEEREKANFANRSKTSFLSSMSHELRTPMNAIIGFSQLMKLDIEEDSSHAENLNEIINAGDHLLKLINEILDLAKVESGKIKLDPEPVKLNSVINESLSMVSAIADKNNITLSFQEKNDVTINTDKLRLGQSLINLLSNAIKYNRENGSVEVYTETSAEHVRVSVKDSGHGIAPEYMDKLFEPFHRLAAENSDIEGTGIGLTLTRRIIQMMEGKLSVESKVDVGSIFCIELPLKGQVESEAEISDTISIDLSAGESADSEPGTVLYVENDPRNKRLVQQMMTKRPALDLHLARDGLKGLELIYTLFPDLVLLDIHLPGLDAYEILNTVRGDESSAHIPVIALTASAMQSDIEKIKQAGFDDYIIKPLDITNFFKLIDKYTHLPGINKQPFSSK